MNDNVYRIQVKLNLKLNNLEFPFFTDCFQGQEEGNDQGGNTTVHESKCDWS